MADQRAWTPRQLRRSLHEHRDALAAIIIVVGVVASFVGLLWIAQGQMEHVLEMVSGGV